MEDPCSIPHSLWLELPWQRVFRSSISVHHTSLFMADRSLSPRRPLTGPAGFQELVILKRPIKASRAEKCSLTPRLRIQPKLKAWKHKSKQWGKSRILRWSPHKSAQTQALKSAPLPQTWGPPPQIMLPGKAQYDSKANKALLCLVLPCSSYRLQHA